MIPLVLSHLISIPHLGVGLVLSFRHLLVCLIVWKGLAKVASGLSQLGNLKKGTSSCQILLSKTSGTDSDWPTQAQIPIPLAQGFS
jgi:hypothetical protein